MIFRCFGEGFTPLEIEAMAILRVRYADPFFLLISSPLVLIT